MKAALPTNVFVYTEERKHADNLYLIYASLRLTTEMHSATMHGRYSLLPGVYTYVLQ